MRGFRGNRSAQNAFNSRFGKDPSLQPDKHAAQNGSSAGESSFHNRIQLPEWLKTPETKERERQVAQQARVVPISAPEPKLAAPKKAVAKKKPAAKKAARPTAKKKKAA